MMRNNLFGNDNNLIDVLFYFDGKQQYARPVRLTWENGTYELAGVQFWYAERKGKTTVHHYRVGDLEGRYTFSLALETENLTWQLEKAEATSIKSGLWHNQGLVGALS